MPPRERFAKNLNSKPKDGILDRLILRRLKHVAKSALLGIALVGGHPADVDAAEKNKTQPQVTKFLQAKPETISNKRLVLDTFSQRIRLLDVTVAQFESLTKEKKEFMKFIFSDPETIEDLELKDKYFSIWNMYREANNKLLENDEVKKLQAENKKIPALINNFKRDLLPSKKKESQSVEERGQFASQMKYKINFLNKVKKENEIKLKNLLQETMNQLDAERLLVMMTVINRTEASKFAKANGKKSEFSLTFHENVLQNRQYSWTHENKFPLNKNADSEIENISFNLLFHLKSLYEDNIERKSIKDAKINIVNIVNQYMYGGNAPEKDLETIYNVKYSQANSLFGKYQISDMAKKIANKKTEKGLDDVLDKVLAAETVIALGHVFSIER